MENKRITVFTPTYNRRYILEKLYQSLLEQQFHDFEWLIIDDGSDDETESLVEQWIDNAPFSIRYYKQNNGGKHRAVNKGLDLAQGDIFIVVDSDDSLTEDALEKIDIWFQQIAGQPDIVGVAANKGVNKTETVNCYFSSDYLDKSLLEMNTYLENGKYVLRGERALAFYTEYHRRFKYPEFDNEKFMTEAVVYNRMAHEGQKMRFFNDIICLCEYQTDGLSSSGTELYLNNPRGYGLWFKERGEFMKDSLSQKWKMWYSFYCDLKDRYSSELIAESIGAPKVCILVCEKVFRARQRLHR